MVRIPRSSVTLSARPMIALLIQTASAWQTQVLRGIAEYAHEHGPWDFFLEPRGPYERLTLPRNWEGDGVIARVNHAALERAISRRRLPAVNVSWYNRHSRAIPKVVSDQVACARLAAEHLMEHGFRNYAYLGPIDRTNYRDELGEAFVTMLSRAGHACETYRKGSGHRSTTGPVLDPTALCRWLDQLVKPVAVLVWNDRFGREVVQAAAAMRLSIPDQVAILSAERDPLLSALSAVPLSGLDMAPNRIGYEAAALLDRLLGGEPSPQQPTLIPPVGVIQRQSTDTIAVEDEQLAEALRFIRENAHRPIQVEDVLEVAPFSRRALEQRFRRELGRSPAAEIRRARLERAKRLLVETDLPLSVIAVRCGFNHLEVMIRNFQQHVGVSPGRFRKRT